MRSPTVLHNQRGSALVIALLILVVLTLLGIAALTTSTVELQISGNDKVTKRTFYSAEGGTQMGSELLEQNIDQKNWTAPMDIGQASQDHWKVTVVTSNFYMNTQANTPDPIPSDTNRDAFYPKDYTGSDPHTNIRVRGRTELSTGSAIQLAAGYEGKGKGAAGGGAWVIYDVRAQYIDPRGNRNAQATIDLGWRHVM
ncbi:MAG TPA: PilX N-terminal domain-containing pilus assembly protein [Syntrophobacteria bacterium]|nr:PilX N-terminal domain-containing pilus assembly protein [Syntrophobacteria bacterium]